MGYAAFYINLEGIRALVVGGGSVGLRRTLYLLQAGAHVTVVAERPHPQLDELAGEGKIRLYRRKVRPDDPLVARLIGENSLIVVATGDERVDSWVAGKARELGKLVNNAARAMEGNLIVPFTASVLDGRVQLASTSLGATGIVARRVLEKAVDCVEKDSDMLSRVYDALSLLKKVAKECIGDARRRIALYFYAADHTLLAGGKGPSGGLGVLVWRIVEGVLEGDEAECMRRLLIEGGSVDVASTLPGSPSAPQRHPEGH